MSSPSTPTGRGPSDGHLPPIRRSARRQKTLDVTAITGAELSLRATLLDTSVAIEDPTDVEVIHDLRLDATISIPDLVIREIKAHAEHQPYDMCSFTIAPMAKLKGLSLKRGYRREVLSILGSTRGCSHFLTLALDLSAANILSIYLRMREHVANTADNRSNGTWIRAGLDVEPGLLNACMALAENSPVIQQAGPMQQEHGD
ncbi:DUF2889 domain-containing protein [Streptomyces sp. NPDC004629]|uniref:DUF2889 domain-containing protein n=1 Tax=Streptomyces sp. NPDC004629 TaxID=3364705 RepID=UPI00369860C6